MLKRKHNARAHLSAAILFVLLALLVAACVPITDPRIAGTVPPLAPSAAEAQVAPVEETAAEAPAALLITHSVVKRPDCMDCHEPETGRDPAPADHAGMTDTLCLYCHVPEEAEEGVAPPPLPAAAEVEFCLGCHGPFEELAAQTEAAFVVDGIEANPHMFVPHDSTKPFKCENCHEVHALPVTASVEIQQAEIDYCYLSCHHEENFTPCTECHDEGEDDE